MFSMKVGLNSKFLFRSFCSRLSTDLIYNNWTRTLDLTVKQILYSARRSTMGKKLT